MIPLRWIGLGAAVAVLALSHGWAWRQGAAASEARHAAARAALQEDLFRAADRADRAAAELAALRAAQDTQLTEFEDEARTDPGAADRRPSADSLRRLEALWDRAGGAP